MPFQRVERFCSRKARTVAGTVRLKIQERGAANPLIHNDCGLEKTGKHPVPAPVFLLLSSCFPPVFVKNLSLRRYPSSRWGEGRVRGSRPTGAPTRRQSRWPVPASSMLALAMLAGPLTPTSPRWGEGELTSIPLTLPRLRRGPLPLPAGARGNSRVRFRRTGPETIERIHDDKEPVRGRGRDRWSVYPKRIFRNRRGTVRAPRQRRLLRQGCSVPLRHLRQPAFRSSQSTAKRQMGSASTSTDDASPTRPCAPWPAARNAPAIDAK